MIALDKNFALIAKMGAAAATTAPDYTVVYSTPKTKHKAGEITQAQDLTVASGAMNGTTNVTLIAAPSTDRIILKSLAICNRDTIAHQMLISLYYQATTERRRIIATVPPNGTLVVGEDGTFSVYPQDQASVEEMPLSGSTNGKGIKVVQTATAGTLIHTAVTGTVSRDFVRLYAVNSSASPVKLTIEWGEATAPDGNIEATIPDEDGLYEITPPEGLVLNNGLAIRAFAASANVIVIHGSVLRIA